MRDKTVRESIRGRLGLLGCGAFGGSMTGLLPSFMIIGERKCGTTSLYRYLTEHPSVLPCRVKETHFFSKSSRAVRRDIERYRSLFPSVSDTAVTSQVLDLDAQDQIIESTLSKPIKPGRRYITGEASANMLMTVPPRRIFEVLPKVKLIVVARDPVARAFSHHAMHVRFKEEGRWQFRFVSDYRRDFERERWASRLRIRGPYLAPGRYEEGLRRWLKVFASEQVTVVRTEDLAEPESQARVLAHLCDFLDLDPFNFSGVGAAKLNVASRVARDPQTADWLRAYFAPSTARLERLLGRSMAWDAASSP